MVCHCSMGENNLCHLLSLSYSICWGFRASVNPPNVSQRRHTVAVMAVVRTISKCTLQILKSILPIWKKKKKKWKSPACYSDQNEHIFIHRLCSQLHRTVFAFTVSAGCLSVITGHQEGQKPFWLSEPGWFGKIGLLGDDCLVTKPILVQLWKLYTDATMTGYIKKLPCLLATLFCLLAGQ